MGQGEDQPPKELLDLPAWQGEEAREDVGGEEHEREELVPSSCLGSAAIGAGSSKSTSAGCGPSVQV